MSTRVVLCYINEVLNPACAKISCRMAAINILCISGILMIRCTNYKLLELGPFSVWGLQFLPPPEWIPSVVFFHAPKICGLITNYKLPVGVNASSLSHCQGRMDSPLAQCQLGAAPDTMTLSGRQSGRFQLMKA